MNAVGGENASSGVLNRCPHCGSPVAENARFCPNCGKAVIAAAVPGAAPKKSKAVWWVCGSLAGLSAVTVACIAILGGLLWSGILPTPGFMDTDQETNIQEWPPQPPANAQEPTVPPLWTQPPVANSTSEPQIPTELAAPPQPVEPPPAFTFNNISLTADPAVGSKFVGEIVPAEDGGGGPGWAGLPAYTKIQIGDYPLQGTFHEPQLMVFDLQKYYASGESAKAAVSRLQQLLEKRNPSSDEALPFLPEWNAAQAFHAAVGYVTFKNGSGVRYLTQYGQDINPVNNHDLFYTFQGITTDGRYYVSAILPISMSELPADGSQYPGGSYESFSSGYPDYIQKVTDNLSAQPNTAFSPDLKILDDMISSLEIKSGS